MAGGKQGTVSHGQCGRRACRTPGYHGEEDRASAKLGWGEAEGSLFGFHKMIPILLCGQGSQRRAGTSHIIYDLPALFLLTPVCACPCLSVN